MAEFKVGDIIISKTGTMFMVIVGFITFCGKFYPSAESLILNITAPKVWLILEIKNLLF
jgi:hypothetical protein